MTNQKIIESTKNEANDTPSKIKMVFTGRRKKKHNKNSNDIYFFTQNLIDVNRNRKANFMHYTHTHPSHSSLFTFRIQFWVDCTLALIRSNTNIHARLINA